MISIRVFEIQCSGEDMRSFIHKKINVSREGVLQREGGYGLWAGGRGKGLWWLEANDDSSKQHQVSVC